MSFLEVVLAATGFTVTALVVAGMILITPRGQVALSEDLEDLGNANPGTADPRVAVSRTIASD